MHFLLSLLMIVVQVYHNLFEPLWLLEIFIYGQIFSCSEECTLTLLKSHINYRYDLSNSYKAGTVITLQGGFVGMS